MSTIHPTYPEVARHEVTRRLRAADEERLRRLARHPFGLGRRTSAGTACR
jgi:hypothetical protein